MTGLQPGSTVISRDTIRKRMPEPVKNTKAKRPSNAKTFDTEAPPSKRAGTGLNLAPDPRENAKEHTGTMRLDT